jgi:tetraacyldisaccharide 4'-kinase
MLGPTEFRDLVSGRRRGVGAGAMRAVLRIAETPYALAMQWRNRRYDLGRAEVHRVEIPVISVGNLTLGGTGKTPMVKWLAQSLRERGLQAAIVSRGYGAESGQDNDEAIELAQALPNVLHVQNRNRVAAARRAIELFKSEVILLDDGFQHRRLARDLDIVLLDALEPFGFEHVFPRGTLREPPAGLNRADVVCLSRADVASTSERDAIRQRVAKLAPEATWCELTHAASGLINSAGDRKPLDFIARKRVTAFCGIGNPAGFRHTLGAAGCRVVAWREFPDHHAYTAEDVAALGDLAFASKADLLVCTHKDLVKIAQHDVRNLPLWAVVIEMRFLSGQTAFEQKVAGTLAP